MENMNTFNFNFVLRIESFIFTIGFQIWDYAQDCPKYWICSRSTTFKDIKNNSKTRRGSKFITYLLANMFEFPSVKRKLRRLKDSVTNPRYRKYRNSLSQHLTKITWNQQIINKSRSNWFAAKSCSWEIH